jgi:phage-related protein
MESIDKLLLESSYSSDSPELFDSAEKIESQKKELKEKLDSDSSTFTKLEKLYSTDQKSLLYMYRYSNDYKNHMETFGTQDDKYQEIKKNIDYFSDYMNYKSLET